jgi:hypothetical protein
VEHGSEETLENVASRSREVGDRRE